MPQSACSITAKSSKRNSEAEEKTNSVDLLSVAVLLLAGCAAGLLAGFFAVDIGLFTLPILLVWYSSTHVSVLAAAHLALGTTLLVSCAASIPSTAIDHRGGFVAWKDAVWLIGAGTVGGVAGGLFSTTFAYETLLRVFGISFFVAGLQLFSERRKPKVPASPSSTQTVRLGAYGLIAGGVAAVTGMANKLLLQPLLYSQLRMPLKRSSGTANASSVAFFFAACTAVAIGGFSSRYLPPYAFGYLDTLAALPLAIGATLFVHVGHRIGEGHTNRNARLVLGILLIAFAMKVFVAP